MIVVAFLAIVTASISGSAGLAMRRRRCPGFAARVRPVRALAALGIALAIGLGALPTSVQPAPLARAATRGRATAPPTASATIPLTTADGFTNANAPYAFSFPRDHAAHFGYASEWWYYTGHLTARDGRRFGYELTFFRIGLRPGEQRRVAGRSAWRGNQIYAGHFALTDESGKTFVHFERLAREALGAGSSSERTVDVHVDDWSLVGSAPFRMHARAGGDAITLTQVSVKVPAVHGHAGISVKAGCATCASHYYSLTRLATAGTLVFDGQVLAVRGVSWMDHEFGSGELQPNQAGWDWFSLQLDDGRELMLYRLRQKDGSVTPQSSGSVVDVRGNVTHLRLSDFAIEATGSWKSPHTGATYPSGWRVRVARAGIDVTLAPTVLDQELANANGGVSYWEGAVDVRSSGSGRSAGVGYVELTGYAGSVAL